MSDLQIGLDYVADDTRTGYRLERLEVLNWGTFDGQVCVLRPDGQTGLLTGDIGTGKSTLVDAVTTLLVPANRIAYNKAAGAASRERTLRSYVLGHYKVARRDDEDLSARPVALRDDSSYSVVLGVFKNEAYMQTVTVAQVFWVVAGVGQPKRFYAGVERALSIAADFSRFGGEIKRLRRTLRHKGRRDLGQLSALRGLVSPPLRHTQPAGAGTLSPDRFDEVRWQSDELRAASHAGTVRCGYSHRGPDFTFR